MVTPHVCAKMAHIVQTSYLHWCFIMLFPSSHHRPSLAPLCPHDKALAAKAALAPPHQLISTTFLAFFPTMCTYQGPPQPSH